MDFWIELVIDVIEMIFLMGIAVGTVWIMVGICIVIDRMVG